MGIWYEVQLRAGKNVAKAVDSFIKIKESESWEPEWRKDLPDGSALYMWDIKWRPGFYQSETDLIKLLQGFDDINPYDSDEDYKGNAYKLLCLGEDGSTDYYCNDSGEEIFEDSYISQEIKMPEEKPDLKKYKDLVTVLDKFAEVYRDSGDGDDPITTILKDASDGLGELISMCAA